MKHIEISKFLTLSKANKYEVACATFDLVDHIFKLDIPRSLRDRKISVQAISLLADGAVQYGYEKEAKEDDEKKALEIPKTTPAAE